MLRASGMKIARITRGVSQIEIAKALKRSQTYLSNVETHKIEATPKEKHKIAQVLKTSEDVLFR